jgi:hypothetical protein
MPDREFIHSYEDVQQVLRHAQRLGLTILAEGPREGDPTVALSDAEIELVERGCFLLFQPDWVGGPLLSMRINAGYNAGKHFVMPRVNFASIALYLQGECDQAGRRRLGSGNIMYKREWLHDTANEMRPSPPTVAQVYKALCKHMLSKDVIRAGVHRYHLCAHAARLALTEAVVPPFDFIPWPPEAKAKP